MRCRMGTGYNEGVRRCHMCMVRREGAQDRAYDEGRGTGRHQGGMMVAHMVLGGPDKKSGRGRNRDMGRGRGRDRDMGQGQGQR